MTTTDNSRADALTVAAALQAYEKAAIAASECEDMGDARVAFVRSILTTPVEQHEAAPAYTTAPWKTGTPPTKDGTYDEYIVAVRRKAVPGRVFVFASNYANNYGKEELSDSNGDEYIADGWYTIGHDTSGEFDSLFMPMLEDGDEVVGWQEMPKWNDSATALTAPSAPLEGTGNGADAWMTEDGRVISDAQKQGALRDGGASASSVRPFSIELCRRAPSADAAAETADERVAFEAWMRTGELDLTPTLERDGDVYDDFDTQRAWRGWQARAAASQPAAAARQEAVAWFDKDLNNVRWKDGLVNADFRDGQPFYTAPPAQVATREEMDDAIEYAIQVLRQVEAGDGTFVGQCADAISGLEEILKGDKQ